MDPMKQTKRFDETITQVVKLPKVTQALIKMIEHLEDRIECEENARIHAVNRVEKPEAQVRGLLDRIGYHLGPADRATMAKTLGVDLDALQRESGEGE